MAGWRPAQAGHLHVRIMNGTRPAKWETGDLLAAMRKRWFSVIIELVCQEYQDDRHWSIRRENPAAETAGTRKPRRTIRDYQAWPPRGPACARGIRRRAEYERNDSRDARMARKRRTDAGACPYHPRLERRGAPGLS